MSDISLETSDVVVALNNKIDRDGLSEFVDNETIGFENNKLVCLSSSSSSNIKITHYVRDVGTNGSMAYGLDFNKNGILGELSDGTNVITFDTTFESYISDITEGPTELVPAAYVLPEEWFIFSAPQGPLFDLGTDQFPIEIRTSDSRPTSVYATEIRVRVQPATVIITPSARSGDYFGKGLITIIGIQEVYLLYTNQYETAYETVVYMRPYIINYANDNERSNVAGNGGNFTLISTENLPNTRYTHFGDWRKLSNDYSA